MSSVHHHDFRLSERSLGELLHDLMDETRTLIRKEIELAKTEMSEKAAIVGRNAGIAAGGAILALIGVMTLVACAVIALGYVIGYALSALVVGIVVLAIGGGIAMKGIRTIQRTRMAPVQAQRQMEETKRWIRHELK